MGYPRSPYLDRSAKNAPSTFSRLVAIGRVYVCCSLGFIGFAVTIAGTLGPRILDHEMLGFGVAGIAFILVMVGASLLIAFFFWELASRPIQQFSAATSQSGDLWDEQLDG
jgi:hypothetical protein